VKNFLDACIGAIMWWAFGYAIAFGTDKDRNKFAGGGDGYLFFNKVDAANEDPNALGQPGVAYYQTWFFQFAFSAAAVSITSGAVAERCQMAGYLMYSMLLVGFVYPVVVHWCWSSDGWLSNFASGENGGSDPARTWVSVGVIDFAGSGVVHLTGGVAGFMGALILGPRTGRFDSDGSVVKEGFSPQSSALQALGTFILWFGWYAFNAGSTLGMFKGAPVIAARCCVTTTLSASACAITNVLIQYVITGGEYSLGATLNGVLGGLVSITAGCPVVEPGMAVIIGMVGAVVYTSWSNLMLLLKIDDVVDAVAVHGACGMWGVIAASLFAKGELSAEYGSICQYGQSSCDGLFYGGNGKLLGMAFLQIVMIWLWVGGTMGVAFFVFDLMKLLRVSVQEETYGLDASHHGGMDEDQINPLGPETLIKMRDEGVKLDKTSLLAMCIDQNVQPLPVLAKFDKVAGPSGVIEDNVAYGALLELVGYDQVDLVDTDEQLA
jgi:Amt family ammonium transporter